MCSCGCSESSSAVAVATRVLPETAAELVAPHVHATDCVDYAGICALDLDVRSCARGRVTRLTDTCSPALLRRLAELGIRAGSLISVQQKTSGNGRIVACGPMRYALDCALCSAIMVEPVAA